MYIRKTTTKKAASGTAYSTFRLVVGERIQGKVRQRTILNIGSCFDLHEQFWPQLCKRIDDIIAGRLALLPAANDIEEYAQKFSARIIAESSVQVENNFEDSTGRFQEVDIASLELIRPRTVGVEHIAMHGAKLVQLPDILQETGLSPAQIPMALASIIARMAKPSSERGTWNWLTTQSGLDELLDVDFSNYSVMSLYRISDVLLSHKNQIEERLFSRICSLFSVGETVTLYDLTNTYFEGEMKQNSKAARGFSKEKRFDCPLLTLALVLDGSGFVKKSQVFEGNASEAGTVRSMLEALAAPPGALVVMDRGMASQATLDWLVAANYRYLVVSRERIRCFDKDKATTINTASNDELQIYREVNHDETEAKLYCYSPKRSDKEQAIVNRFCEKFENELKKLSDSLGKTRTNKSKDRILQRIGRLEEKSHGISQHYSITVTDNAETTPPGKPLLATAILFEKKLRAGSIATHPGVYCLRSNALNLDAEQMWRTYIMLTDLEAVFRSLKSELGLRPVYHQTAERAQGHLFITVLAYQCVQSIRHSLKTHGIHDSWHSLREAMASQHRITATFRQRNGNTLHIRKSSLAEASQVRIYKALQLTHSPGGIKKHSVPGPDANVLCQKI